MIDKIYKAKELRHALKKFVAAQSANFTDSEKMEVAGLYSKWKPDASYSVGTIVKFGYNKDGETQLYEVLKAHTSTIDNLPDETISLYKKIGFDEKTGLPIWTQPLGESDAYNLNDKVVHNGKTWISSIDINILEPGVSSWQEV